jgi:ABC-2 type transport system ATP-binding protein
VKRYGDVVAVAGLDLAVAAGECFGLLGPNGAGKTTTIEILEGLTPPDGGEVEVLGQPWRDGAPGRALRERLGIQLQETQLADKLTVAETVQLFRSFYHRSHTVDEVLALVELEEKRGARVASLSGGQKQRLAVACALVSRPDLLFLDEPTTGLDPQSRRQLWAIIGRFRGRRPRAGRVREDGDGVRHHGTAGKPGVVAEHHQQRDVRRRAIPPDGSGRRSSRRSR